MLTDIRDQMNEAARELTYPPPGSAGRDRRCVARGKRLVMYRDGRPRVPTPDDPGGAAARRPEGDASCGNGSSADGVAQLVIGSQLMAFNGKPCGIEMYLMRPERAAGASTGWPTRRLRTVVLSLLVAMVLALLAARGVLRPVRELRRRPRLAAGKLDTRLRVRGADELADLA